MNVLSLFSGVGGLDLGLERAGMRVIAQCEQDAACRRILAQHWPDVPCHEDVAGLDAGWLGRNGIRTAPAPLGEGDDGGTRSGESVSVEDLRLSDSGTATSVELVAGGFPCQDLSVAGQRKGFDGERSVLFYEAARIADLVLGDGGWLLIENVPGLLSSNGGRDFGAVLASLAELGFHDLAWRVLDSRYFGVPQRRRRVFILARRSGGDRARQVLLEPESGGGDFTPSGKAREGTASSFGVGTAGTLGSTADGGFRTTDLDGSGAFVSDTAKRLTTSQERQDFDTQDFVTHTLTSNGYDASEDGTGRGTPLTVGAPPDPDGMRAPSGVPGRMDGVEMNPKPDGPRYAQMGNAVSVPVAEWIGRRIVEYGGDEC